MDGTSRAAAETSTDTASDIRTEGYDTSGRAYADTTETVQWWTALFGQSLSAGALKLEPASIKEWLKEFGETLYDITNRRGELVNQAASAGANVQLGSFRPSQQIVAKMAARMGESEGGMAWALNSVLLELGSIHEALRQSLASHLDIDLNNAKIIGDIRKRFNDEADSAPR